MINLRGGKKTVMDDVQDVVIGLLLWDHRILLTQRHPSAIPEWSNAYQLPGGKVEPGETPEEGLVREWNEELSADINVGDLVWVSEVQHVTGYSKPFRLMAYVVSLRPTSGLRLTPAGGQALLWEPLDQARSRTDALPSTQPAIDAYLQWLREGDSGRA